MAPRRRQSAGLALVMVLILMTAAAVIGMSCLYSTSLQTACGANQARAARAKYLAESGVQHAIYLLQTDLATMEKTSASKPMGPYHVDSTDDSYTCYCTKLAVGTYQVLSVGLSSGSRQTAAATVTRDPAAKVTTPATLAVGSDGSPGSYLTVMGNYFCNGSLNNRAYIYGDASATGSITDTYNRISGAKTPNAPRAGIPQFCWSDFLSYTFYTTTYQASATEPLKIFNSGHALAGGRAITATNPGGIVLLRPQDGVQVDLSVLVTKGTLVIDGDLLIKDLASIEAVAGYPALVVSGKILIRNGAVLTVTGLVKADKGIWPEVAPAYASVTITGGVITNSNGYNLDVRGSSVLRQSADRATVYDFQCRDSLPKVQIVSWDD